MTHAWPARHARNNTCHAPVNTCHEPVGIGMCVMHATPCVCACTQAIGLVRACECGVMRVWACVSVCERVCACVSVWGHVCVYTSHRLGTCVRACVCVSSAVDIRHPRGVPKGGWRYPTHCTAILCILFFYIISSWYESMFVSERK